MIQIESVLIRELRGIRELEIKPNRKNFVVSGPNGSGKSGVVDAIQFALTGEMSRLAGRGTGGLSVNRHGPHIDHRDDPVSAEVSLRFYVPDLEKSAVLTRNVSSPKTFKLEPDESDIRTIMEEVATHPELTLSRREIIKYIIVEAGQRSREIQALLQIEVIGQTRGVLKTTSNKLSIVARQARRAASSAGDALRRQLDVATLNQESILAAINPRRQTLGLAEIADLQMDTDLSAGILEKAADAQFNKEAALRDLEALQRSTVDLAASSKGDAEHVVCALIAMESDSGLREVIARRPFVERGLQLVHGSHCPLCDTEWEDEAALVGHLRAKLAKATEARVIEERLLRNAAEIASQVRSTAALVDSVQPLGNSFGLDSFGEQLARCSSDLKAFAEALNTVESIAEQRAKLERGWGRALGSMGGQLEALRRAIQGEPDQSESVEAQTFLTRAQDRFETWRGLRRAERRARAVVEAGRATYSTYYEVANSLLEALYEAVEDDFASYYRAINATDEGEFKAKLEPAEGGLDLDVAFYDKGMHPPGAYHSEGHQDGMGLCLYLALMRRLLGDRFRLAVFDDVVMSVDQGHRKELCGLLKEHFPKTQFIITTHDRVWAKQMQTAGLIESKGRVTFHSWSLEAGPIVEQGLGVWDEIEAAVARGDTSVAAGRLRRHMEYVAAELADQLQAKVPFRGDASYDLGELLGAVIGRHGALLSDAARAANSWDRRDAMATIKSLKDSRKEALAAERGEGWVVNKAVHYNEWATFTPDEFRDVVQAFKQLLAELRCSSCESWFYVTPRKGHGESLRCRCGSVTLNLIVK